MRILLQLVRGLSLRQSHFLDACAARPVPYTHGRSVLRIITIRVDRKEVVSALGWASSTHRRKDQSFNLMLMIDQLNFGVRNHVIDNDHASGCVSDDWLCGMHSRYVLPANHIKQIEIVLVGHATVNWHLLRCLNGLLGLSIIGHLLSVLVVVRLV